MMEPVTEASNIISADIDLANGEGTLDTGNIQIVYFY